MMFIEFHISDFSEITFVSISLMALLGHNLWLVAKNERNKLRIEVVTSDNFPESDSAVKPERIADFRLYADSESIVISNYETQDKSLVATLETAVKANLVALELRPHPIILEAEKFARYIASEAAENFVAPYFAAGETDRAQRESYAKFAKVLIDSDVYDKIVEQKLEIILTEHPQQIKTCGKLKFKVLFDGAPVEGLRVSVGAENLNGGKYIADERTDGNGLAELKISADGLCFARTHFIRPHFDTANFDWESFWASVTFRI